MVKKRIEYRIAAVLANLFAEIFWYLEQRRSRLSDKLANLGSEPVNKKRESR